MPHRTHTIFLTCRLTKTLQKPFLQNFHVVIKIHLPLPLEYEVMVSSNKRETTFYIFHGKNKLKVFTWKAMTPPFSKILLVARFTLLWHHDGPTHWTAALTSLWLPPRFKESLIHDVCKFLVVTLSSSSSMWMWLMTLAQLDWDPLRRLTSFHHSFRFSSFMCSTLAL